MAKLLLFDIDGTLIDSNGAGGAAILDAAEQHFGIRRDELPPLQLAGATDPAIAMDVFGHMNRSHTPEEISEFLDRYLSNLQRRLQAEDFSGFTLPGVVPLLDALRAERAAHLGLLTGNVRRGAVIKLSRHGIYEHFIEGGFGSDHHDRNQLGPVALQRMQDATGRTYDIADVIVIGDTPKDIRCAEAFGAKCLAVATGQYSAAELSALNPWRCVESFADVPAMMELLLRA
ncbi:haloacid dehalogenase-like hydrolase [Prosthecobacter sp.]|uniref:haloacid dehalogenase-like hydrolase n=1 Tax=Prosthecobacter sp. TaxID=1965333 RepID=UPI001DA5C850|nr:haloacid dehalogenase-like hydrolase [Prosthecobacter sp.]MCB1279075.1 HAD family hydrolase [Prosthecobacter sp.]